MNTRGLRVLMIVLVWFAAISIWYCSDDTVKKDTGVKIDAKGTGSGTGCPATYPTTSTCNYPGMNCTYKATNPNCLDSYIECSPSNQWARSGGGCGSGSGTGSGSSG